MMSNSGTMLSLMAFTIAMLVQDTFQLPTPAALVDVNPFETVPEELNLTEWKTIEDAAQEKKLQDLTLLGLNKLRESNGVKGVLTTKGEISKFAREQAKTVCDDLVLQGDDFNIDQLKPNHEFFNRQIGYGTQENDQEAVSPSTLAAGSIRHWYERARNGTIKDTGMDSVLDADTKYAGLGLCQKTDADKKLTYYAIVLDMATETQFEKFAKSLAEKKP